MLCIMAWCIAKALVCTEHAWVSSQKLVHLSQNSDRKWQKVIKSDRKWAFTLLVVSIKILKETGLNSWHHCIMMPCRGIGVHRACLSHFPTWKVGSLVTKQWQKVTKGGKKVTESEHSHFSVVQQRFWWKLVWIHDTIVSWCLAEALVCTEHASMMLVTPPKSGFTCGKSDRSPWKWQKVAKKWQKVT
jgi:hypothetical protein